MNCINRVISSQKSCHVLGLPSPNTYGMNFSNEELKINFGQAAAKISEVKVGGKKVYLLTQPKSKSTHLRPADLVDIFFDVQN